MWLGGLRTPQIFVISIFSLSESCVNDWRQTFGSLIDFYCVNWTKFGRLIFRKIIQIVATRCHWNATNSISARAPLQTLLGSLQHFPRLPSWILRGLLLKGREGRERGREQKGEKGKKRGRRKGRGRRGGKSKRNEGRKRRGKREQKGKGRGKMGKSKPPWKWKITVRLAAPG